MSIFDMGSGKRRLLPWKAEWITGTESGEIGLGLVYDEAVRVCLCTASDALAERLQRLLLRWAQRECIVLSVERTDRFALPEDAGAHLLFLDLDSVELPEQARPEHAGAGLIVISGDAGRVLRSYRWHPAAFLKPDFDQRAMADALRACEKHWRCGRLCLESPSRRRPFRLPLGTVRYVEAEAHYCVFNQGRRSVRLRYSIDELEPLLPLPPFARCHRSYLVRLDAVERMSYTAAALRGGESLPLGRKYGKALRASLEAWQKGEPE